MKVEDVADAKRRRNVLSVTANSQPDGDTPKKDAKAKKSKVHTLLLGCKSAESKAKWKLNLDKCIAEVDQKQRT